MDKPQRTPSDATWREVNELFGDEIFAFWKKWLEYEDQCVVNLDNASRLYTSLLDLKLALADAILNGWNYRTKPLTIEEIEESKARRKEYIRSLREEASDKRWTIYVRDGFKCRHCGSQWNLSIDHITPISKGGWSDDENLQTLCRSCNSKKKDRTDVKTEVPQ